jgi:hypothetical protein
MSWCFSELRTTVDLHNAALDPWGTCRQLVVVDMRKALPEGARLKLREELRVTSATIHSELKERFARSSQVIFMTEAGEEAHDFCSSISVALKDMPYLELFVFSGPDNMMPSFFRQSLELPYLLTSVEFPSQITDNIFLGDFKSARWGEALTSLGIRSVIDVSNLTREAVRHEGLSYLVIEKNDHRDEDMSIIFQNVCLFEKSCRERGKLLIHCQAGISRSATLVLSILMTNYRMTLKDAWQLMSSRRTIGSFVFYPKTSLS